MADCDFSDGKGEDVLLLVDRRPLRRAQLLQFLRCWANESRLRIVASDYDGLVRFQEPLNCRLVVLSISTDGSGEPGSAAVERVIRAIHPGAPIVIMGDSTEPIHVTQALRSGAAGYISADIEAEVALAALSFVMIGGSYFPVSALRAAEQPEIPPLPPRPRLPLPRSEDTPKDGRAELDGFDDQTAGPPKPHACLPGVEVPRASDSLTARQREVLTGLKDGLSNKQIARNLDMSEATVKVHVRQVMRKLGALNRTQAAVLALRVVGASRPIAPLQAVASVVAYPPAAWPRTAGR
jgi:DNA-binding NarL/FixJ family response regulator